MVSGREWKTITIFQNSVIPHFKWKDFDTPFIITMKKVIFTLLLVALVASTTCSCGTGSDCSTCNCGCGSNPNCQITPPECLTPNIEAPCVCPPNTQPPTICVPNIDVPTICPPPVVAPPPAVPCDVYVPPPVIPLPCPPTPPPVGNPNCPTLPPPPPAYCPPSPPSCSGGSCSALSNKFTLTLKYACRKDIAFDSCQGNIVWNGQIIASLGPNNYNINTLQIVVYAKQGQNKLQFQGTGQSDSFGLFIDDVQLIRYGNNQNIVVNGGFEQPNVGNSWGIFTNIPGWTGNGIEIGWASIYTSGWNSQVLELDGNANYQITQTWTFDSFYKVVSGSSSCDVSTGQTLTYKLEFQYAARKNGVSSPLTSKGVAIWNGVIVANMNPTDYYVHTFSTTVKLRAGENVLEFDAAGSSDTFGLTIDNVKVFSTFNSTNLVVNGNFETPNVGGVNKWNYFNGGIYGWQALKAEVGHCQSVYNSNWAASTQQCIELDSDSNQRYKQSINIAPFCFTNLIIQQKTVEGTQQIQNQLSCATGSAQSQIDNAIAKIEGDIYCQIQIQVSKFNQYIAELYQCNDAKLQNLQGNSVLVLNQYDCFCDAWKHDFGSSNEPDFDDSCFDNNWDHGQCVIDSIAGKNIHCHDNNGNNHHLQVAPCTHFEGQWNKPKIGKKLFFKGKKHSSGKIRVKWATNCDC